jgi:hypothetical protein
MKKDRAKQVAHFFLIVFIVMNYAHGFLPQFLSAKNANLSFFEYLDFIELKYGSSIPNKALIIVISPGMLIGKILRYIVYGQEVETWPRFPMEKREGKKEEMIVQNPGKSHQGFFIHSNNNLHAWPILYIKRYKTKLKVMRKPL